MTRTKAAAALLAAAGLGAAAALSPITPAAAAGDTTVAALASETHFHGLAVAQDGPSRLLLATHHGVYAVDPGGSARRLSSTSDDFMGFTPHPADRDVLYASGHPAGGGNLGFIASHDGGRTWRKLADGVDGPVDFHQMDVSAADPQVVYGVYDGLQKSADGGKSWSRVGPAPEGLIDLAASSRDARTLYAGTQRGLLRSTDSGRSWQPAHPARALATMVHVGANATIYAFIAGTGLLKAAEPELAWQTVTPGFGGKVVLHLAADPRDEGVLYVATFDPGDRSQAILTSRNGGASWSPLGGE